MFLYSGIIVLFFLVIIKRVFIYGVLSQFECYVINYIVWKIVVFCILVIFFLKNKSNLVYQEKLNKKNKNMKKKVLLFFKI